MFTQRLAGICLMASGVLAMTCASQAAIIGPYTVDANTLHLWHINDSGLPVTDAPTVGTPIDLLSLGSGSGGALGATSYPGFGTAYNEAQVHETGIFAKTPANSTADNTPTTTFWNQSTGAFTYECLVRIDFDPTAVNAEFVELISMENDAGSRPFNFALNPLAATAPESYEMIFQGITSGGLVNTGTAISIQQNHWYHAAVTYDGLASGAHLKLYWTDMGTQVSPDGSATVANLIFSGNLTANLTGTNGGDFALGAEARNTGGNTGQWAGLIDEVRISDIARSPDQMMFGVPEPSTIVLASLGLMGLACVRRHRRA